MVVAYNIPYKCNVKHAGVGGKGTHLTLHLDNVLLLFCWYFLLLFSSSSHWSLHYWMCLKITGGVDVKLAFVYYCKLP